MRKIINLGFFVLKTNYTDLGHSINCTIKKGHSRFTLLSDMVYCSLKYGSSFVDYFNFNFYNKSAEQKSQYATMAIMYKFHRKINDAAYIDKVDDKKQFFKNFSKFCNPAFLFPTEQKQQAIEHIQSRLGKRIVIKDPESTAGKGVRIFGISQKSSEYFVGSEELIKFCEDHYSENSFLYLEDFIVQHSEIDKISPTAVNTIRVITLINNQHEVEVIGSVFRISVNCAIDNYSAGNLAAEIDKNTGVVISGGIRKRSSCDKYHEVHPVTNEKILGFKIPHWDKVIEMITEAATVVPQVRTIGWDIAITENGPIIIEGNNKWNKDTWQIPAGEGKLKQIKMYL